MPEPATKNTALQNESIWQRLYSIKSDDPDLKPDNWCSVQPCKTYTIFGAKVLITQPSSTFWVYLLGLITCLLGIYFITTESDQISRLLWGWSLILWGIGALLAGTSYQAFGYQLKCKGREEVAWTSWWEVVYLVFQQLSVSIMLLAIAYSGLSETGRLIAIFAAALSSTIYTALVVYGAFKPVKALITFELMVHFCTPFIVFCIALNGWRYWQFGQTLDLALLGSNLALVLTMYLYEKYMALGITNTLWKKGTWFSENDVLHVALIAWIIYLAVVVEPLVSDL